MASDFRHALVGLYIFCSILIIATNLFMMGVILYSPALRQAPRNALVVGICVADLLMGSFVTPMFTRTLVESQFPDCHTHLALQLTGDHGVFFIVGWTLVILNTLHVVGVVKRRRQNLTESSTSTSSNALTYGHSFSSPSRPQSLSLSASSHSLPSRRIPYSRMQSLPRETSQTLAISDPESPYYLPCPTACNRLFPVWIQILALTALPWLVAIATIAPVVLFNASVTRKYRLNNGHILEDVMCMLRLPRSVLLTAMFLSLYLPFYLCVIALVTMIFCHSRAGHSRNHDYHHPPQHQYLVQNGYEEDSSTPHDSRTQGPEASIANGDTEVGIEGDLGEEDTDITDIQPHLPDADAMRSPTNLQPSTLSTFPPLVENMDQEHVPVDNFHGHEEQHSQRDMRERGNPILSFSSNSESLVAHCLPNAVYLMCYTPLLVHTWLHLSGVYTPDRAYGLVLFILLSRSFLMPLSWLAFSDIRHEASELWCVLKTCLASVSSRGGPGLVGGLGGRASMSSSSSVTFSRLQETQTM